MNCAPYFRRPLLSEIERVLRKVFSVMQVVRGRVEKDLREDAWRLRKRVTLCEKKLTWLRQEKSRFIH